MAEAVCVACGADKELALARCGRCGHLPVGEQAELSMVLSTRVLTQEQLAAAAERLRKGEAVQPSAALRAKARALLKGATPLAEAALSRPQVALLAVANVLVTPILGYGVWFTLRRRPGPGATQALIATVPISVALAVAWWMART